MPADASSLPNNGLGVVLIHRLMDEVLSATGDAGNLLTPRKQAR